MRALLALGVLVMLGWPVAVLAAVHGNLNVNYFNSHTDTEGQPSNDEQMLMENLLLDVAGPITPKLGYAGYLRGTRIDQWSQSDGTESSNVMTLVEPDVEMALRDPLYNVHAGYRRTENWQGANFANDQRQSSNYYFTRIGLTPLRLPSINFQYDRMESFDYLSPSELNVINNMMLCDISYQWQPFRAYYSFNYNSTDDAAAAPGEPTGSTNMNHMGRLDYSDILGAGMVPVAASYQVSAFNSETQGGSTTTTPSMVSGTTGRYPGLATTFTAGLPATLSAGDNVGFQFSSPEVVDQVVFDLNDPAAPSVVTWQVYGMNQGGSSWSFLAEVDAAKVGGSYTVSFANSQAFSSYKIVYKTVGGAQPVLSVGAAATLQAFNSQVSAGPSQSSISQTINVNTGVQVNPNLSVTMNFYLDKVDQEPSSYLTSLSNLFPSVFQGSVGRPGGADSSSSVNRSFGPSVRWLPTSWAAATFNYQRQDLFDSEKENVLGANSYSAILNFTPLATLDGTLSYVRSEQELNQQPSGKPSNRSMTITNSYLASVTARLLRGLDWVNDVGYTNTSEDTSQGGTQTSDTYYASGALNAQVTPTLFSTMTYSFNWSYSGESSTSSRTGSLVVSWRPTARVNTSYSVTGSDTGDTQLLAQSLSFDWLVLPAVHFHLSGTQSRTYPGAGRTETAIAQAVYYVNRYMDLQAGYSYNSSKAEIETTTQSFNLFFNGRF